MKKRSVTLKLMAIFLIFISLSMVSAGIYFSDLQSKYNLGDMINLDVSADPVLDGRLLKVLFNCQGKNLLEFNNLPDSSGKVNIKIPLSSYTVNGIEGNCYFSGNYNNDARQSREFEISKRLDVKLYGNSFFVNPGEQFTVSGRAERLNGFPANGEIVISIPLLEVYTDAISENMANNTENNTNASVSDSPSSKSEYYAKVVNGSFLTNISIKDNTPAGEYRVDIFVYEEISGEKASEGTTVASVKVFQILKSVEIALNNQNFNPGTTVEFKPGLLDQSGINIDEEISTIIRNEKSERVFEKIVNSQETVKFLIPTNLTSGYYEIEASSRGIKNIERFYVNEKAIVSFDLRNETLVVTNIGNIPYKKDIEVDLNGKPFVKSVDLDLGESKTFKLTGSNEEYRIKISDGDTEFVQGGVMLTGRTITVSATDEGSAIGNVVNNPIVWIFLILILIAAVLFFLRNYLKKRSFAYHVSDLNQTRAAQKFAGTSNSISNTLVKKEVSSQFKQPGSMKIPEINRPEINKQEIFGVPKQSPPSQAEQLTVMEGHKSNSVVIALKIKNEVGGLSRQTLDRAMIPAYKKSGAVYEQGNYIFIIFSQLMTRNEKNEVDVARVAESIAEELRDHNRKYGEKIDFGIGINSGEVINKVDGGKLKFTALGNFILLAKRLAESSDKQVLISKKSYEKGMTEIKAEKIDKEGEVYEIKRVVNNEENKVFIKDFLNRMEKDEKSKNQSQGFRGFNVKK